MLHARDPYPSIRRFIALVVLLAIGFHSGGATSQTNVAVSAGAKFLLAGGGFETPQTIPPGTFATPGQGGVPPWGAWTFQTGAGIASETSTLANLNPPLSPGDYCAFVTGVTSFSRLYTFSPGVWRLRFRAAQRVQGIPGAPDAQIVRVMVGGLEVAEFLLRSENYDIYTTRPMRFPSTSTVTIAFEGTVNGETALIDEIQLEPVADWQDPTHWSLGTVPVETQDARVPADVVMAIDGLAECDGLKVTGELLALPGSGIIRTEWFQVTGVGARFEVGYELTPHLETFTVTLLGDDPNKIDLPGAGTKFLLAENGATIEMHGKPQLSWTRLAQTANALQGDLVLSEAVDWEVGDRIIIAGTNNPGETIPYPMQAENRKITAISGSTVTLDEPLLYRHNGTIATFSNGVRSWTLDQRAEVGLLTRNVRIQGGYVVNGFGGHVMIRHELSAGTGRFSNVEFFKLGQNKKGRYPIHFHLLQGHGATEPLYVKNCAIRRSSNRAAVIHGTDYVTLERNVAYNHFGHGIFLEDGGEQHNKIRHNLVIRSKKAPLNPEALPTEQAPNTFQNRSPASYWITNPNNEIVGNVAGGTEGVGFWLIFPEQVQIPSANFSYFNGILPNRSPLGTFSDNSCHSSRLGLDVIDGFDANGNLLTNLSWHLTQPTYIDRFTAYGCEDGLYAGVNNDDNGIPIQHLMFRDTILADLGTAITFAGYHTVIDSAVINNTNNSIQNTYSQADMPSVYEHYDGAGRLRDSYLVGFQSTGTVVRSQGGADKHTNHLFSGLTYDHAGLPANRLPDTTDPLTNHEDPRQWGISVLDEDGSLTGFAGHTLTSNHPMMVTDASVLHLPGTFAYVCPYKFGHLKLDSPAINVNEPDVTITRTVFDTNPVEVFNHNGFVVDNFKQLPIIVATPGSTLEAPKYRVNWPTLPDATQRPMDVIVDDLLPGDVAFFRFENIANLPGLTITVGQTAVPVAGSWHQLNAATQTTVWFDNSNGVWLRMIATGWANTVTIDWTGP